MEIQHYSHQHKLIFISSEEEIDGSDSISCHLCEKPVMGTASYNCSDCNFFLHTTCAELPNKIQHRFHRQHRLTLSLQDPETCYICKVESKDLFYICKNCNFTIDTKCASSSSWKQASSHQHRFILLKRSESFRCDACGIECDLSTWSGQPHLCTLCHIVVHDYCRFVPETISITQHHHPLTHTYMVVRENEVLDCTLCHTEVSTSYGSYYCQECCFTVHVHCALRNLRVLANPVEDYQVPILPETEEVELDEEELPSEINHFSHPHKLVLSDDEIDYDYKYYCHGCILPIQTTFYKCEDCDFMLHKTCTTQSPESMEHWLHNHTLTLLPESSGSGANATFSCSTCRNLCRGFSYCCDKCFDCKICARCASVPYRFKHAGHQDVLSFVQETTDYIPCNACSSCENSFLFKCQECSFVLCYQCATLPATIERTRDGYRYILTYDQSIGNQYDCDLCKKDRDPKHWFYYCAKFDYCAHPKCVLAKFLYLKLGSE